MSSGSFKKCCQQTVYLKTIYKQDLSLNNPQWLICHKTQPTNFVSSGNFWVFKEK